MAALLNDCCPIVRTHRTDPTATFADPVSLPKNCRPRTQARSQCTPREAAPVTADNRTDFGKNLPRRRGCEGISFLLCKDQAQAQVAPQRSL